MSYPQPGNAKIKIFPKQDRGQKTREENSEEFKKLKHEKTRKQFCVYRWSKS